MRKLYFAHPVTTYGTPEEAEAITLLSFVSGPTWQIVNPNNPAWAGEYKRLGMQFFLDRCAECDACAYMPFPNGKIGAGVAKEVESFLVRGAPVERIEDGRVLTVFTLPEADVLSVDETRALIAGIRASQSKGRMRREAGVTQMERNAMSDNTKSCNPASDGGER